MRFLKKTPLVTLPFTAYFLLFIDVFLQSSMLDPFYSICLFTTLITIDFIIYKFYTPNRIIQKYFLLLIYTSTIIFWFGLHITNQLHLLLQPYIDNSFFRYFRVSLLFALITFYLVYILSSKKNGYYFQNVFWIIFCISLSPTLLKNIQIDHHLDRISNHPIPFPQHTKDKKTTLLIILDEYSSPDDIIKYSKNAYTFADELEQKGWKIKSNVKTKETKTIQSLASLFNYNISNNKDFVLKHDWSTHYTYYIQTPALIDSLENKKITIYNYGLFHLGKNRSISNIYFFPANYFELITSKTYVPLFADNFRQGNYNLRSLLHPSSDVHNKLILHSIPGSITQHKNSSFIFAHLYMPHTPFAFDGKEFNKSDTLHNYIQYWHFTNEKIKEMLSKITLDSNIRIILSGDHGLRENKLDPHSTFAAFWGFHEDDLKKVETVQDLGSLINAYY